MPLIRYSIHSIITASFVGLVLWCVPTSAAHAETSPYAASVIGQSNGTITMVAGQAITVWVDIQNTGTATWKNSGRNFVALNATDPVGRVSPFRHAYWPKSYRPAILKDRNVAPGATTRIPFAIQAPNEVGTYSEAFQLVAENLTWITGSRVQFSITVTPKPPAYNASVVNQSVGIVHLQPNQAVTIWADIKNTGTATWKNSGRNFVALNVTHPSGRASAFRHAYWRLAYRPAVLQESDVRPGETTRIAFALQAPDAAGEYSESFQLVAENLTWIEGSTITLPVVVANQEESNGESGPSLDVGITHTTETEQVVADGPLLIKQGNTVLASEAANTTISLRFSNGTYIAESAHVHLESNDWFSVTPQNDMTILEVPSYENRPLWNQNINDNKFRGSISLRYSESTGRLWVVNTLPLESYLRGIAETSNDSYHEFQKTLIVAARTYAQYHITRATKHADEHFTVDGTNDQVYRGYNFELRSPNVSNAVSETRGEMVTYNTEVVVTPYFSQSDGRTRSWEEVWSGGPYPWLVSVPDPLCNGMQLLGHGVGMSAKGALLMAGNGSQYKDILGYYYSGTSVVAQY